MQSEQILPAQKADTDGMERMAPGAQIPPILEDNSLSPHWHFRRDLSTAKKPPAPSAGEDTNCISGIKEVIGVGQKG